MNSGSRAGKEFEGLENWSTCNRGNRLRTSCPISLSSWAWFDSADKLGNGIPLSIQQVPGIDPFTLATIVQVLLQVFRTVRIGPRCLRLKSRI